MNNAWNCLFHAKTPGSKGTRVVWVVDWWAKNPYIVTLNTGDGGYKKKWGYRPVCTITKKFYLNIASPPYSIHLPINSALVS